VHVITGLVGDRLVGGAAQAQGGREGGTSGGYQLSGISTTGRWAEVNIRGHAVAAPQNHGRYAKPLLGPLSGNTSSF
jgi:hypothetical protein